MNLGTEDRKKMKVLAVLGGLLLIMVVYRVISPAGGGSTEVAANAPTIASNTAAPAAATRVPSRRTTAGGKKTAAPPPLDPTLKLALLESSEAMKYTGNGRNIFQAQIDIPKPIAKVTTEAPHDNLPPPTPPPPPINLKFFGFASKAGEPKRIFLSKGEDVFIAGEGDIVDRRYKILQIGPASVTVQDVLTNNTQQIPLTQG